MTTSRSTEVEADREVPLVRVTRTFDAARERVFAAHTDGELVKRWFGPRNREIRIDVYDCRPGGSYRVVYVDGGRDERAVRGCFHDVQSPGLIVQTFAVEGSPQRGALETLVFEAIGTGLSRLTSTLLVDSFNERDGILAGGMADGVREAFERLDELLAETAG